MNDRHIRQKVFSQYDIGEKANETIQSYIRQSWRIKNLAIQRYGKVKERRLVDDARDIHEKLCKCNELINSTITRLVLLKKILVYYDCDWKEYGRIMHNIQGVIDSLKKTRNLGSTIASAVETSDPDKHQTDAINVFMRGVVRRVKYIKNQFVEANIELTPIKDYLDITGEESFFSALSSEFHSKDEMMDDEKIHAFADKITSVVAIAGKTGEYEPRLHKYNARIDKKIEAKRLASAKEKADRKLKDKEEAGIALGRFIGSFHNAMSNISDNERFNLKKSVIYRRINEYGRDCYVVLATYVYSGKTYYRYLGKNALTSHFGGAKIFSEEKNALDAAKELAGTKPYYVVEAVPFFMKEPAATRQ